MADRIPQPHDIVNDVMRRWPETVGVFADYGMVCGACPIGTLHTVEDAALEYQVPLQTFLSELRIAAATKPKPTRPRATTRLLANAQVLRVCGGAKIADSISIEMQQHIVRETPVQPSATCSPPP